MSVKVRDLTKIYGAQRAVNGISFEAKKGSIMGFLGPNGAGKTTTMKIITCFIPQTAGKAEVCGFDVEKDSIEVRRRIGYLPEHNPLYKDMYVKEYLEFVGGLNKVKKVGAKVREMIERTGLEREQKKLIGALSKGYRQRVGLAQAMLHDPDVLILDEPTSGLDPNQLAEIRTLIKHLGQEKTVIFSTHIMQEVQALCDQVLIINKGEVVANDPIDKLQSRISGEAVVTVEFKEKVKQALLQKIVGVKNVSQLEDHKWQLTAGKNGDLREQVFKFAVEKGFTLLGMQKEAYTVEDIFQKLTR